MRRSVRFVKYWEKGSTVIGADQMAPALRAQGVDAESIAAVDLAPAADQVLIFIKRADLTDLLRARLAGAICVVDLQDTPVFRYWISHWPLYHAFIFRNARARRSFWWVGGVRRTIYHHWDPRYEAHRAGDRELKLAYIGIPRSIDLWEGIPDVEFVGPDEWFDRAPEFNAHLSLRAGRREWRYKPNAKVATAAACEAVLLTTPDCSSVELLGEDYPFYIESADRPTIEAAIGRARDLVGGPEWRTALERLRALKRRLAIDRIAREYVDLLERLEEH